MKKLLGILLAAALLVSAPAVSAFAAEPYAGKTVLLYTGNVRGDVDVYPQIKAARDAYEAAGAQVLLVDAGNYLQGGAAANTDRGLSVYSLMDAAGYDVAAMGLAEFGYTDAITGYPYHGNVTRYYTQAMLQRGTEAITYSRNRDGSETAVLEAKEAARFRTVASNISSANEAYSFEESAVITTASGLRLGFFGMTDPEIASNVQDGFVSVAGTISAQRPACDLLVLLSNAASSGEQPVDILIEAPTGGDMVLGAYVIDGDGTIAREDVTRSGSDEAVAALAARAKENAGAAAGISNVILNGADSVNRNGESNLGDLTTDALVWYAKTYMDGLDADVPVVAIQNGGNCDNFLYTGEITETDLLRALPFSPMGIGVLYVTGEQLLETIEAADQRENCAGFAQVSGLSYTLDLGQDYDAGEAYGNYFKADSVNRVAITAVAGGEFDPDATYALVCDNFLINGNDTFYTLKEVRDSGARYLNNGNGVKTRDAVALYIQQALGGVIGEHYSAAQGRITVVKSAFSDVPAGEYYARPVSWAVERGITSGLSAHTFGPDETCTRAQTVTFLWHAAGDPEPVRSDNPFADVSPDDWYYKAVLWAYEKGITAGTGENTFGPGGTVTRGQTVTFLWKYENSPEVSGRNRFADVAAEDYFARAVDWAAERGITSGTSPTAFGPGEGCTRAQIVTFLYQLLSNTNLN